ncbi:MAG: CoA transferase [Ignavibacteriae bacterium]|nr:CoA transferase [Ignavibacteriota bacterium]
MKPETTILKPRTANPKPQLPLSHIRVLDLTRILSGPFCTMKLGDMGAEVIKIEQPAKGDDTRTWGPPFIKGESAYFLSVNRNKKSLTLDLKSDEGKKILTKLITRCDVLVENFRAGVMEKLGLGFDNVKKINPRIIYCSISGYGQTSSRSHKPSYDLIVQGESGLMDMTGFPDGPPTKVGISLADVNAGNLAFEGILLALLQREKSGKGQFIDISLLDGLLSLFAYQSQIALSSNTKVIRKGNRHPTITPYETYGTKDGYINIAVGSEGAWENFCKAIQREEVQHDKRFATNARRVENREALEKILIPIMKKKRSAEWIRILSRFDVPAGNINPLSEILELKLLKERSMITSMRHPSIGTLKMVRNPIKLSQTSPNQFSPPPLLGQHTVDVLKWLGYSDSAIQLLKNKNVI